MAYFPFFVDLQDKKCFIMGGGEVAYRKAAALLPFGAHIYIKALTYCEKLTSLKKYNERTDTAYAGIRYV